MPMLIDCITITKYTPARPTFIVRSLSLEAHRAGFVVLNPQFKATQSQIDTGAAHLNEYLRGHKHES